MIERRPSTAGARDNESRWGDRIFEEAVRRRPPCVIDAYVDEPLRAGLRHLAPVLAPRARAVGTRTSVLEIGCGTGWLTRAFAAAGIQAHGIDQDVDRIAVASARRPDDAPARFEVGDVHSLPYDRASFDAVVSISVLQYVSCCDALAECCRVLKPGGRAMFIENLRGNPLARAYRAVRCAGWPYPPYGTPRSHLRWSDRLLLADIFGEADIRPFHLISPVILLPHAFRGTWAPSFSSAEERLHRATSALDSRLLRAHERLHDWAWLAAILCTKSRAPTFVS